MEAFSAVQIDASIDLVWLRDCLWLQAIAHLTLSDNFGLRCFLTHQDVFWLAPA